jgi:GNAT superfamily N-acetyltransferase
MDAIVTRAATPEELPAALALLTAQLAEHDIRLAPGDVRRGLATLLEVGWLGKVRRAYEGERAVGLAILAFTWTVEYGGLVGWLDELYVIPERRERGIGARLLAEVVTAARDAGCVALELEVEASHARAEALYSRAGFAPLQRRRWSRRLR